jgi:hypothetical protein
MEVYLQAGRANDNDCLLRTYLGHFDSVDWMKWVDIWFIYGIRDDSEEKCKKAEHRSII